MKNQTSLIPAFIPVILMIMILSCEKDKDNGKDNNLLAAMEGHILAEGQLVGKYKRQ